MDIKPTYPNDFQLAARNIFKEEEVNGFLRQSGTSTRFVYGTLMLPIVLKWVIDVNKNFPIWKQMTPATLYGYELFNISEMGPPVISASSRPGASVEGMLIFGLQEHQKNEIHEFEAGLTKLASVDVEICVNDLHNIRSMRTIPNVGTFVFQGTKEGLLPVNGSAWNFEKFIESPFYQNMERSLTTDSFADEQGPSSTTVRRSS